MDNNTSLLSSSTGSPCLLRLQSHCLWHHALLWVEIQIRLAEQLAAMSLDHCLLSPCDVMEVLRSLPQIPESARGHVAIEPALGSPSNVVAESDVPGHITAKWQPPTKQPTNHHDDDTVVLYHTEVRCDDEQRWCDGIVTECVVDGSTPGRSYHVPVNCSLGVHHSAFACVDVNVIAPVDSELSHQTLTSGIQLHNPGNTVQLLYIISKRSLQHHYFNQTK